MPGRWPAGMALFAALLFGAAASAEEPYLDFLRGLRERHYFDTALYYLDQLATRTNVPDEIRQVIPYEKAVTLLESSKASRNPEKQVEQLDQALAFLEQFVKASPSHPLVGDANTERAQILLGKARVEIVQSRSPANVSARGEYQTRARDLVVQARAVYDAAFKQHEANWKKFPTFIDKTQHPEQFETRDKSHRNMLGAKLNQALCTYEEAQTHDAGSESFKKLLNDAAAMFQDMYERNRSEGAGLYARLYQGKCFEEQGDLPKALGIYNELLAHPGNEPTLLKLKDQTLQFKLICLNSKERDDHQVVVDLGEEWLRERKADARSPLGLGIRWEVARGYEALGERRDIPKDEATRAFRMAREHAEQVNRVPGEFRDLSLALIQRLEVKLGGKERQPVTFDAALGHGRQMITEISKAKDALEGAVKQKKPVEELRKMQQDFEVQLKDAARMFDLALRLVARTDDAKSVNTARFMYAYVNFLLRKNYEAAILGEYVARTADRDDTETGLEAAYLSMAAYVQAFNDSQGAADEKQADIDFIVKACNLLTDKWPDSDKANDARMTLGHIYSQIKRPVQAAEWYGKVPEADERYPEAQLAAGQAYWTAFLNASRLSEADRPTPEQLAEWQTLALQLLRNGVARMSATAPKEGAAPPELIAGKFSLAQIAVNQGQDAEAIKLLLDDPQPVTKAVAVADETKRPDKGVQSREFATETYKLLLRAYIGGGKLDEARDAMKTLEKIAAGEAGSDVTDLYVGLGKLLREELNRFQAAGETERFNKLMNSFETFLNDLAARKEGQNFGSLSWIGETYFALGEASAKDASRSTSYYDKAAKAFQDILNLAREKPDFLQPDQVAAVKVRLARCHRFKKDFETAEQMVADVIQQKEKDVRAQVEAAYIYQDWGVSGLTANADKCLEAINGVGSKRFWGWASLGKRLRSSLNQGRAEFLPMYIEARINGAESRRRYAAALTDSKKRDAELAKAEAELVATVSVIRGITDEQFAEINKTYKQILADAGKPVVDLKPVKEVDPAALAGHSDQQPKAARAAAKATQPAVAVKPEAPPAAQTGAMFWIGVVLVLLIGSGAAGWILFAPKKKHHSPMESHVTGVPAFSPIFADAPAASPSVAVGPVIAPPKPKPRPAAAAGTTTPPTKSATKPAQPKPKPKPSEPK